MNAMMTASKQTKRMVGFVAVLASVFTLGGTLALAEHYARSSADGRDNMAGLQQAQPAAGQQAHNARVAVDLRKAG